MTMFLIPEKFMPDNKLKFPPLIEGDNLERAFFEYIKKENPILKRKYINVNWANIYYNTFFKKEKFIAPELQTYIDCLNQNDRYFAILQYSSKLDKNWLPKETMFIGNNFGSIPMPLLYENKDIYSLSEIQFSEKRYICSFIGYINHPIRRAIKKYISKCNKYIYYEPLDRIPDDVNTSLFLYATLYSKFTLAPRGFGKSSYRFFEALKLGSIPVYIYDDDGIWLPFRNKIEYNKFSIILHAKKLINLNYILNSITETKYNDMRNYYKYIVGDLFTFNRCCREFIKDINRSFIISAKDGLGDQLFGYSSIEVLAYNLGSNIFLDMPMFSNKNCPIKIKDLYNLNSERNILQKNEKIDKEIFLDCQKGKTLMKHNLTSRSFWEEIDRSQNIKITNHLYILDSLVNNNIGSISFNNEKEILKAVKKSLIRFFKKYCTIDYSGLYGYKLLNNEKYTIIHLRTGEDKYMFCEEKVIILSKNMYNKFYLFFSTIFKNIIDNNLQNQKILLLSDINNLTIYNFINHANIEGLNTNTFFNYSNIKSVHSYMGQPKKEEWDKIVDDFMLITRASRAYVSPNSNFSRAGLILNENLYSNCYFVYGDGKIIKMNENVLKKEQNRI